MGKRVQVIISIIMVILICIVLVFLGFELFKNRNDYFDNVVDIDDITVVDYEDGMIRIKIKPSNNQFKCSIVKSIPNNIEELNFNKIYDDQCTGIINPNNNYVYFQNSLGITSEPILISDYVYDVDLAKVYYLPIAGTIDFNKQIKSFGAANYKYEFDGDFIEIKNNILTGLKDGNSDLKIYYKDNLIAETKVYVTKGIVTMPKEFDYNKKHMSCNIYSEDDARLMDEILEYRISTAGYGTRAGVVAAGRFLTLEFPYRIHYFFENGRIHESSPHYCDAEGRYYHKGLYLHKYKYKDVEKSVAGPATWGCNITNYEPYPPRYTPLTKMPNGLDCSGFVSWALLNGGFDVGDIGAGESAYKHQLTDRGEYTPLTKELIKSGTIKTGDLFNYSGHIALLIGQDEKNYYIAESLPGLNGLVAKTYPKDKVTKTFTHVVLMDVLYKEDGNLTDMWY
ncbi:MAG: hypothetical protein ACI31M_00110 [Bacilli bacterium]